MGEFEVEKIIRDLHDIESFRSRRISVLRLLTAQEEEQLGMSMALVYVPTVNQRIINHGSDASYTVIRGKGYFNVGFDGSVKTLIAQPGETIRVPKDTPYWDVAAQGEGLLMLSINHPPYDPGQIELLDPGAN